MTSLTISDINKKRKFDVKTKGGVPDGARLSAEALVKEAEAFKVETGDPLPLWVARAFAARAEADFQMLWEYQLGLPAGQKRLELEAECTKYLKLASGWDANNHDYKVVPDTPIAPK